jgi:hypothetical protein
LLASPGTGTLCTAVRALDVAGLPEPLSERNARRPRSTARLKLEPDCPMPVDSDMARLRRPYTRYARRLINRTGLGALVGAVAGVIGATLTIAGGIWLLTFTRWAGSGASGLDGPTSPIAPEGVAGLGARTDVAGGAAGVASALTEGGAALLSFAAIPFSLVGYGLALGALLGLAHGLVVRRDGPSGPIELIAALTGGAVGWQIAGPWLAAVPPLADRARLATAVAIAAAALGSAVGGALWVALRVRPQRGDFIPED